jgi:guanylate kinase
MIELDDGIRLQRALSREQAQENPKYEEMCRRFLADSEDFADEKIKEAGIERRFENDNLERCMREIKEYIQQQAKEKG